jgi:RNA polymerase sigma factor (sigma-70 family)
MSILNTYLRDISRYQRLTIEQELTLGEQARAGNQQARKRLIEAYLILPVNIAYQNLRPEIDLMDLIQEGNIGLIKAVDMFHPAQGNRLGTLARFWVEKYILRFLRDEMDDYVSLDMPVVDSGETLLLSETIEDRGTIMGDQGIKNIETIMERQELQKHMNVLLKNLSSNDLEVLQLFYGLNGYPQMNRHEISALIGISQDQISRIKTRALNRLKRLIDKN